MAPPRFRGEPVPRPHLLISQHQPRCNRLPNPIHPIQAPLAPQVRSRQPDLSSGNSIPLHSHLLLHLPLLPLALPRLPRLAPLELTEFPYRLPCSDESAAECRGPCGTVWKVRVFEIVGAFVNIWDGGLPAVAELANGVSRWYLCERWCRGVGGFSLGFGGRNRGFIFGLDLNGGTRVAIPDAMDQHCAALVVPGRFDVGLWFWEWGSSRSGRESVVRLALVSFVCSMYCLVGCSCDEMKSSLLSSIFARKHRW
ncbi:hypothetical protein BAUCODRAFT_372035 [Baudoinia panamericana UAMH 10762]|uniref:Uncharacterized protein n=1 Tax=Baudoinia panamericana (strain UAMH 10762) TaxID=717646 RepID=M2N822_BAUPA|nr:uncharacterized protein BAUCODRAFT_372035 [Baudoinia panamericana UAMH 10762]EMD00269.1 hypothetical protein BAUCODRAFT_372035 [Baudoinia panamericana UAMH 10762]